MIEKLIEALHEELDDVKKYMLLYAQAHEEIAPEILGIAEDELHHARMIVGMIHKMGGEISDEDLETVEQAEAMDEED
ncbi:MAG: hypothetical protein J6S60_06690 [Oscillospiraceae bacterium]|nr:hypothetical protein [Oscillospiraceae bacterium]